jgi:ketosteroid isomerase-like protein
VGESADVVKRIHERFNERDEEGFVGLCSKRIVWREIPEVPGSGTYQGPDEVRDWYRKTADVSDDLTLAIWELEEKEDAVLTETSAEMTGRGSDVPLGWRFWCVWRVKEGLITSHQGFSVREEAVADLEGVGSESAG